MTTASTTLRRQGFHYSEIHNVNSAPVVPAEKEALLRPGNCTCHIQRFEDLILQNLKKCEARYT
jgi:hypothetical protein